MVIEPRKEKTVKWKKLIFGFTNDTFFTVYGKESSGARAGCFEKKTTSAVHGVDCGVRSRFWKFKNDSRTNSTDLLQNGWGYIQNRRCLFTNLSAVVDQREKRKEEEAELLASAT